MTEAHIVPEPLVPASRWQDFIEWANDGGYGESWHDHWDSKFHELQMTFLEDVPAG